MTYSPITKSRTPAALVIACTAAAFFAQPAAGQTATKLDCKNCVKSKQLKNNGIKSKDIKDGQVTSQDLADNAVTSGKIQDGSITGADVSDGTIGSADLAPGALTTDDILARILVVSPVGDGSNTAANGQELLDAITFLGGVSPAPGAINPWLIKIEPGLYDVGSTPVLMLPFVDIEGSGQKTTRISGTLDGIDNGVVTMASDTELRHVTVVNSGGGGALQPTGVSVDGTDILITHVTAMGFDGSSTTRGIRLAKNCNDATLTNVTATAQTSVGGGTRAAQLDCDGENSVNNLVATASGGTFNQGLFAAPLLGRVVVRNSRLTGSSASVQRSAGTAVLVSSQLDGPVTASANTICVNSYDGTFDPLDEDCQVIP